MALLDERLSLHVGEYANTPVVLSNTPTCPTGRGVRSTTYGQQARLLTSFWMVEGRNWDWENRIVYLPKSP
jgi:hypothetical protein